MTPSLRDDQYLAKLRTYYKRHRAIPSMSTISGVVGLSSTSSVFALVGRLTEEEFLQRTPDRRVAPGKKFFERQLVSSVRAGVPQEATQEAPEGLAIDDWLVDHPNRTVLLRVRGDSMKDAGLLEGDLVLVLKGVPAKRGDIVVAIVDDQFTVKYLDTDKRGNFFLRPANVAYEPIRPKSDLEIFGRVVGSIRKYAA